MMYRILLFLVLGDSMVTRALPAHGVEQATIPNLRPIYLQMSDLPRGFGQPVSAVYTRYAPKIVVGNAFCAAYPALLHRHWQQALIQRAFQPNVRNKPWAGPRGDMTLCAYLFGTSSDAQALFFSYQKNRIWAIKHRQDKTWPMPRIGDWSFASWQMSSRTVRTASGPHPVKTQFISAAVLDANVVLTFSVSDAPGPIAASPGLSAFVPLLRTIDIRLHRHDLPRWTLSPHPPTPRPASRCPAGREGSSSQHHNRKRHPSPLEGEGRG